MRNVRQRITRLEKAVAEAKWADSSELREAFCREHHLAPDAVLIGFAGGAAIIALPQRETDDPNTESS